MPLRTAINRSIDLTEIFTILDSGNDGIYSYKFTNSCQSNEMELRKSVASRRYRDYSDIIAKHHSFPVMDKEVDFFLRDIRCGGIVIDVGGGWGWHWRRLKETRPDIIVFIVDFVKENLVVAKDILKTLVDKNVYLVHGDATSLVFDDNTFDGYWSVQTLQHIPDFFTAVQEAYRVLKPGGVFANYSLNVQSLLKSAFRIFRKTYHVHGKIPGSFYLSRASREQISIVNKIFSNEASIKFTEILFKPELRFTSPGRYQSFLGRVDKMLSSSGSFFSWIARQQSFHVAKPVL